MFMSAAAVFRQQQNKQASASYRNQPMFFDISANANGSDADMRP